MEDPSRAARAGRVGSDPSDGDTLSQRLRTVHVRMVEAVLGGGGLGEVAELAAEAAGGPVAVIVPRLDAAVTSPGGAGPTCRRCAATSASAAAGGR